MTIDIVFSGAGPQRFPAYVGVLKNFRDRGMIPNQISRESTMRQPRVCGTSAGALIGGLYASGVAIDDLEEIIYDIDPTKYADINTMQFAKFLVRYASGKLVRWVTGGKFQPSWAQPHLNSHRKLHDYLLELTAHKKFEDVPGLYVIASNMTDGRDFIFSKFSTPDAFVATGIMASIAIPFVFEAVQYRHDGRDLLLMDGGIHYNFPVDFLRDLDDTKVVGVTCRSMDRKLPVNHTFIQLVTLLIGGFISSREAKDIEDSNGVPVLEILHSKTDVLDTMAFASDRDSKNRWIRLGEEAAEKFLI